MREFGLPDVAIEVFDDSPENRRSRQRRNPRGDRPNNVRVGFRREVTTKGFLATCSLYTSLLFLIFRICKISMNIN